MTAIPNMTMTIFSNVSVVMAVQHPKKLDKIKNKYRTNPIIPNRNAKLAKTTFMIFDFILNVKYTKSIYESQTLSINF